MSDPVDILGKLIWLAVIGVFVAHQIWVGSAKQRQSAGICTRCGKKPADLMSPDTQTRATMCVDCIRVTQRNYRIGSTFFYSLAILFGGMAPIVIRSDFKSFGGQTALADAGVFALAIGITAGGGFLIRYFGRKVV